MVISCDLLSNLEVPHLQTNPPWDNSAKQMGPNRPTQVRSDFCESCHFEHVYIPWKCGVFQLPRPCLIIFGGKPWKTYPRKELALGVTASGQLMGATARLQLKSKNLVNLGSAKPATDLSQDLTWYFVFFMFFLFSVFVCSHSHNMVSHGRGTLPCATSHLRRTIQNRGADCRPVQKTVATKWWKSKTIWGWINTY